MLTRAKTGTGKTLAFLIPALEKVLRTPRDERKRRISVLVISPARELASQISAEAEALTADVDVSAHVIFGGTKVQADVRKMRKNVPDVLVATPGRLLDHLENRRLHNELSDLQF